MTREMICKINVTADKMMEGFGSEELLHTLDEFETCDTNGLRGQSEIESAEVASVLVRIFGDTTSKKNIFFENEFCSYLDFDMIKDLSRVIRRCRKDIDDRLETINTLRDIGAYFTYLAIHLNQGILGHRQALKSLTVAVALYDLCQKMLPYVFDDIEFEDTESRDFATMLYAWR